MSKVQRRGPGAWCVPVSSEPSALYSLQSLPGSAFLKEREGQRAQQPPQVPGVGCSEKGRGDSFQGRQPLAYPPLLDGKMGIPSWHPRKAPGQTCSWACEREGPIRSPAHICPPSLNWRLAKTSPIPLLNSLHFSVQPLKTLKGNGEELGPTCPKDPSSPDVFKSSSPHL